MSFSKQGRTRGENTCSVEVLELFKHPHKMHVQLDVKKHREVTVSYVREREILEDTSFLHHHNPKHTTEHLIHATTMIAATTKHEQRVQCKLFMSFPLKTEEKRKSYNTTNTTHNLKYNKKTKFTTPKLNNLLNHTKTHNEIEN